MIFSFTFTLFRQIDDGIENLDLVIVVTPRKCNLSSFLPISRLHISFKYDELGRYC